MLKLDRYTSEYLYILYIAVKQKTFITKLHIKKIAIMTIFFYQNQVKQHFNVYY